MALGLGSLANGIVLSWHFGKVRAGRA
jgi:hypothetical protein